MANNNDDYTISEHGDSSDEIGEMTPVPLIRKRGGHPAGQTSNPFEETMTQPAPAVIKAPVRVSWVWDYYIKKSNEKGEIRAYCQFIMENGEICNKNYKYDGSTGNLNYHIIKHGVTPPTESTTSITSEITSKSTQSITKIGQKEKEESTLRWILLTTQPLSTVIQKAYIEHMHIIDPEFIVPGERKIRMMIAQSYGYNKNKLMQLLKTAQSISLTTDL